MGDVGTDLPSVRLPETTQTVEQAGEYKQKRHSDEAYSAASP